MKRIWNYKKRSRSNNFIVVLFIFLFYLAILVPQNYIFGQESCGDLSFACQIEETSKLIETNKNDPINYYNRAIAYRGIGENELAIKDYTKAIELKADFYQAFYNRSNILYEQGNVAEAIADVSEVIKINPDLANAHFFYGFLRFQEKEYATALDSFNKAIELDPKYKKAYQFRAITFNMLGEKEKAQADLKTFEDLTPKA